MITIPLTLDCAEYNQHYLPHPIDPRWSEAQRVASEINRAKVQDPHYTGALIYDGLVDSLIANMTSLAKEREHEPEPTDWTPPQRCIWRSAKHKAPQDKLWKVVHDRTVSNDVKAFVAVRQGRWMVLCPFPGCSGAQLASFTDHRFWCVDCFNRPIKNRWVDVVWPDDPIAVEAWLAKRPHDAKNWDPGESEEDLMEQDNKHNAVVKEPHSVVLPRSI